MFITRVIPECDYCNTRFNSHVPGYAALSRGATGRWCEVMWFCQTCISDALAAEACTPETAAMKILCGIVGSPGDWPDFPYNPDKVPEFPRHLTI